MMKESAQTWPIDKSHVIPTGFPELEMRIGDIDKNKSTNKRILIIGGTSSVLEFTRLLAEVLDIKEYRITYKCHPSEYGDWETKVKKCIGDDSVEIVHDNKKSIYYYISHSLWVVGDASTVLFEATLFDVNIGIIDNTISNAYCRSIYESGSGVKITSAIKFVELLKNTESRDYQSSQHEKSIFFEKNSLNNMVNSINQIIRGEI